jgi:hypothetical protein
MNKMKTLIKRVIPSSWLQFIKEKILKIEPTKKIEETFTTIYKTNHWNSKESKSGTGSDLSQTKTLIEGLNKLFKQYGIKSILDIPCGDFNWMQKANLEGMSYIGADLVEELIQRNKIKFKSRANVSFRKLDLTSDALPRADIIFCRDCLVHLSYADVYDALSNIKASKSEYLLTTSFPERDRNNDINTGEWRPLNLQVAPFNLPVPKLIINENCTEDGGIYKDKSMCLWEISKIVIPATVYRDTSHT